MSEPRSLAGIGSKYFTNGIAHENGCASSSGVPITAIPSTDSSAASTSASRPPIDMPTMNTDSNSARSARNSPRAASSQSVWGSAASFWGVSL